MAYASRLYPRAEPRGFTLQVIKKGTKDGSFFISLLMINLLPHPGVLPNVTWLKPSLPRAE